MVASAPAIRCRQIAAADVSAIVALLARGFPGRGRAFWEAALRQLAKREPPPGLPQYGYLLESAGTPVGTILLICSTMRAEGDGALVPRCNLSSWYVEPAFRFYAPLLVSRALVHKNVTYLNVSPAPHTTPIIEAQGFARYCDGLFIAVPMLKGLFGGERVQVIEAHEQLHVETDPFEREILLQHAALGCISVWCVSAGRAYPFVFRPRIVKKTIPCARLIYCRDIGDFTRFAGPLGRYLARRGKPLVIVDANGPLPGLVGVFRGGSRPKYFKGAQRPRLGDLAYTEFAVMGV
jgi:hypothetical protein